MLTSSYIFESGDNWIVVTSLWLWNVVLLIYLDVVITASAFDEIKLLCP